VAETDLYAVTPFQIAYLASYSMTALILTVGFIMAATCRLQTELEQRSSIDPLTGLLNRRAFACVHERQRAAAARSGLPIALLLVDLDQFKSINDHYGHSVGDQVLLDFCRSAANAIPPDTPLARIGGEEFAILLTGVDMASAHAQAEAVRCAILHHVGPGIPPYTCSIGVAGTGGADCTLDALMLVADKALYAAKKDGRNRVKTAQVGEYKPQPVPQALATAEPAYAAAPPA
jgi:diguanylate cyclase (GGDEF)-like protein